MTTSVMVAATWGALAMGEWHGQGQRQGQAQGKSCI